MWSETHYVSRRTLLKGAGATLAGMTVLRVAGPANAFPGRPGRGYGHPLVGPARAEPRPERHRPPVGLGAARLAADPDGPVLHGQALRPARCHRDGLAAGRRRPGRAATDPVAGRPQGAAAQRRRRSRWSAPATPAVPRSSSVASATPAGPARRWRRCWSEAGVLEEGIEVVFWGADRGAGDDPRQLRIVSRRPDRHRRARRDWRTRPDDHRAVRPQHVARRRDGPRQPALLRDERRATAARARLSGAADRPGLVRRGQRQVADAHRGHRPAATRAASWPATTSPSARSSATARRSGRSPP